MDSSTHLWCLAILLIVMTISLPCVSAGSCIANGITVCCTKDHCKQQISPDGCYCDNLCRQHGDCCDDIDELCPTENCTEGSIRLSNGANYLQGRVEVCVGNKWGTVCHNKWNNIDAQVVCKQLGYPNSGAAALRNARFSQGIGAIVMTNVNCTGNESSLLDCEHSNLTRLCNHGMDASVICGNAVCADGDVRLVNGLYSSQGRVEVCLNGVWGTVCHNAWDINDAKTVCRQLGMSTTRVIAVGRAYFGSGTGAINLDDVQCMGTEDRLLNCTYNENSDCTHDEDAGVFCGIRLGCLDGSIRLADGTNKSEGRVEICVNGAWGTVCDDGSWDDYAARVTCRQLGYSSAGAISFNGTKFGPGNSDFDVFFTNVTCTGHENNFLACQYFRTNSSMCPHTHDAGVRCLPGPGECSSGKVRLVDGADDTEGRVEVCLFEKWGTVCDHSWSTAHAEVVCRQLGLPTTGATALSGAYFGIGTGPINVDDSQCTGDETNITQCVFTSNDNCQHSNDAGVRCPCNHGDVRLVGGSTALEGRVEVCFSGIWGTVTDDGWHNKDSNVVCRQLGYWGNVSKPVLYAAYGQGKGPIFMDVVSCQGTEQRLIDCLYSPFTFYDSHAEDAGVVCFDGIKGQAECTDGETRLGSKGTIGNRYYGRVEVCLAGQWGTICGFFWDTASSNVVCGSLGYPKVSEPFRAGLLPYPGPGTGPVHMNFVQCSGNEQSLFECSFTGPWIGICPHFFDAGVFCYRSDGCTNGAVRLLNGNTRNEGRVEVCYNGVWGTVNSNLWTDENAKVVCSQLGYFPYLGIPRRNGYYGSGTNNQPVSLYFVRCRGNEKTLLDCPFSFPPIGVRHSSDAGVYCFTDYDPTLGSGSIPECSAGTLRLVGGKNDTEGRVEVCLSGAWGTICDDIWNTENANVVCRQLGYTGYGSVALPRSYYGQGSGSIYIDNLRCTGHEDNIWQCSFTSDHNCNHQEDASVRCKPRECTEGAIRLRDGQNDLEGRIEVCLNGTWGTVCHDYWSGVDSLVVCRQLGYSDKFAFGYNSAFFGTGDDVPILMDNVHCIGNETKLTDCPYETHTADCSHQLDSGVKCFPKGFGSGLGSGAVCNLGDIRLVNGSNEREGRIEICIDNVWGTVCNDRFDPIDARVACRQLGYSDLGATIVSGVYGSGAGPIYMDNTLCYGEETELLKCLFDSHTADCTHSRDVGVKCYMKGECVDGNIRLSNGSRPSEGRVEVCMGGVWGTITGRGWDRQDAIVTCRQLGYSDQYVIPYSNVAFFGEGEGAVHMDYVACTGDELDLLNCTHQKLSRFIINPHALDAGVRCFNLTDAPCTPGEIRLANGTLKSEGRVEICFDGVWGTTCGSYWIEVDSIVVCRQLGYNDYTALTLPPGYYGLNNASNSSSIPIYFVPICQGTEKTLLECVHYQVASCTHFHDTALRCFQTGNCQEGSLRLVGGSARNEGRVEVCQHGVWGTVCDDLLSQVDAKVICRQLGYSDRYVVSFVGGTFGQGTGPIHVDNLDCVGNERRMLDCLYDSHTDDCNHSEDAGVACYNQSQCSHGDIRLVGGNASYEGRLEFCRSGIWGSVCGQFFDLNEAKVICRQLQMNTTYAVPYDSAYYGPGVGEVVIGNLNCNGRESAVRYCQYTSNPSCSHFSDLGVACYPEAQCNTTGKVRLVGGETELEGRVEICLNGLWGTIVHSGWGSNDAAVVCRSLGYLPNGAQAFYFSYFGRGNGRIQMNFVNCDGSEDNLLNCSYSTRIRSSDTHRTDAGVRCHPEGECSQGDIRLADGPTDSEGRVEICIGSTWGTISLFGWSAVDARVVCSELGFTNEVAFSARYGPGSGPIYFTRVSCNGDEKSIFNCTYSTQTAGFSHFFDAGVKCYNKTVPGDCINGDIRLMDGKTKTEGRVELCLEGQWGLVCDTQWSQSDANVACRQLGFGAYGSTPKYASFFGHGNRKIFVEGISCVGTESELIDCQLDSSPSSFCTNLRAAGVVCLAKNCTEGEIRLQGGTNSQGRVEICKGGVWGTVCDNSWDVSDARVVCRQLGFSGFTAVAVSHAYFGLGSGPIYMNNVYCIGSESSLFNCSFNSRFITCGHDEDAGVKCFNKTTEGNCSLGDVRLQDGLTKSEGRVEVCFNGEWGTVCDKSWGNTDASVVCHQLGYPKIATSFHAGFFPTTKGQIFMDELSCRGNENALVQCRYDDNVVDCSHDNDAGARCYRSDNCTHGDLRLVNDKIEPTDVISEGRLEICYNNVWGSVTSTFWYPFYTILACQSLGFNPTALAPITVPIQNYGVGRGPIISVFCFRSYLTFNQCITSSETTRYSHNYDVAILCSPCNDGDLRLSDGPVKHKGRVEICFNNTWGTISDDRWSYFDGKVVCRQLGYSDLILTIRYDAYYNQGTGPIFMTDLTCYGSETRLIDCPHSTDTTDDIHAEDAGIDCYPRGNCTHGELRLANGTMYEGRLEACIDGIWGTVTDDIFSDFEARIACSQLGFSRRFAQHKDNAAYGQGSNLPIVMDNVFCYRQEKFLVNCSYDSVTHFDTHKEDVGIVCYPEQTGNCTLGDVRLINGTSKYEGLVEICIGGKWGTVCDNYWNQPDALVVCRQLGFSESGVQAVTGSYFGNGTGNIFLTNTYCSGNEADLIDCSHSTDNSSCHHGQDAGVICHPGNACTNGDVRLVGGKGNYEGRVEVCSDGVWGTICHDLWDQKDAVVVCRQLNLTHQVVVPFRESYFGSSNHPIVLNRVHCNGDENNLTECDSVKLTGYCSHSDEAGVACLSSMECSHGELRFLNGSNGTEGTIEVCLNGVWGTVCDNYWSTNDAKVACKSLGLSDEYAKPYHSAYFGRGSGPIFLTGLNCRGTENNLTECTHSQDVDCVHAEDAGVKCLAKNECSSDGNLRLANGSIPSEGRLEVCLNGVWGTISDDLWDSITAKVICKQLGYETSAIVYFNAYFGQGEGPIHLDNVFCIGYEEHILDCIHSTDASEDTHAEDVGIKCLVGGNCTEGEIRLVGGQTEHEGRVEICVKGLWGTVSHNGWEGREATVVCRQLGYSEDVALAYPYAYFGLGTGPVALTSVNCDGTENNLLDCRYLSFPDFYNHNDDAGVKCFNQSDNSNCNLGDVRLVDGPQNYSGRVEICLDNQWGTLCGDYLVDDIADTVCGQLGFASQGAVAVHSVNSKFGNATGPIWLKEILCFGNEVDILHCLSDPDTQNCDHSLDIGVICAIGECIEGAVQLVDGKTLSEGRVEVCEGRKWGTVCDDGWDYRDALVICKQLGYTGDYALPYHIGYFSGASIPIAIDYMACTGNETKWTDCSYSTFFTFVCTHDEDAGVKCFNKTIGPCTNGEVRLVNGTDMYEGRVEVCLYGNWTTVCSDYWGRANAQVACRQAGYSNGTALAYKGTYFGQGEGPIYLSSLTCTGSENSLLKCHHTGSTDHCDHSLDAGVRCIIGDECNITGALRIVSQSSPLEGRVEVCIYGVWGTIENIFWETSDARLVCRLLGYSPIIANVYKPLPGSGVIHLSYVDCVGNEDSILQCRHSTTTRNAFHFNDAGVTCSDNISKNCTIGSVQLVNGSSNREGRVEACLNGEDWSAVSNANWNDAEVRVICSSLGFAGLGGTAAINTFGYKNESLGLSNVRCGGYETSFFDCSFSVSTEMEVRGAAATCLPIVDNCTNGDIRLVGGSTKMEGRVEICYGSSWGTISDRFAYDTEARVLCKQLGYSSEKSRLYVDGRFGIDISVPIAYTFLFCRGYESHVSQCLLSYFPPFDTILRHQDDIGISCQPIPISSTLSPSMQLSSLPITPSLMSSTTISTMTPSVSATPSLSTMSRSSQTPVLSSSPIPVLSSSPMPVPSSSSTPVPSSSSTPVPSSSSIPVSLSSSTPVPSSSSTPVPSSSSIPVPSSSSTPVPSSSSTPVPSSSSTPVPSSSSIPVSLSTSIPVSSSRATMMSSSRTPSVVSSTSSVFIQPTNALENALLATINGDFTANTFPTESFKGAVVNSVNTYCRSNSCRNRKRQTEGLITGNDVKIISVINNSNNGVKVTFYVMQGNNVLAVDTLENAVKTGIDRGLFRDAGFSDMSIQKTTIVVTSPTNDSSTSGLSTIGTVVVLVTVLLVIAIIAASVVIIVVIFWMKRRRNSYKTDKDILVSSTSGTFSARSSVIEIGEHDIEPSEVMTDKELKKYNEAMAPPETSEL